MLALLHELHYVFFCSYTERPIADTKTCVCRYLAIITVDYTIFLQIYFIHRKINNHSCRL